MSKATGYLLKPRQYRTSVMPPTDYLYDAGRGNHIGTFTNGPGWAKLPSGIWVGTYDGALSQHIRYASVNGLDRPSRFSVFAWFYATTLVGRRAIWSKWEGGGGWLFDVFESGEIAFSFGVGDDWGGTAALALNTWHFAGFTYDGTNLKSYVNGAPDRSQVVAGRAAIKNGQPADIGSFNLDRFWSGYIMPPILLNYDLAADEIYSMFQAERRWFGA